MSIKIVFDGSLATIVGRLDPKVEKVMVNECLRWLDKSLDMAIKQRKISANVSPYKFCYHRIKKQFPTGLLPRVSGWLTEKDVPHKLEMTYKLKTASSTNIADWAWDHQKDLVKNVLLYKRCIIRSPTASGKTTSISLLLEQFKDMNVLVVAPSINLVNNISADIVKNLGIPVGVIGGGKENWERVTVSTARSLYIKAEKDYRDILKDIDVLIFDECHNYANKTGNVISEACPNTSYRVGLSATTEIETGAGIVLEGVIGPITLVIPDTLMVELGVIHKPIIPFVQVKHKEIDYGIGNWVKPPRSEVYQRSIVENEERNQLIVDILKEFNRAYLDPKNKSSSTGIGLVLVEFKQHGHILSQMLTEQGIDTPFIWGEIKGKKRQEFIDKFRAGEIRNLVASKILNEGEDVPLLEMVINAGGGSGKRGIIQKSGRALRKDKDNQKQRALIVDFYDNEEHYLERNSLKRIENINNRHPGCAFVTTLDELNDLIHNRTNSVLEAALS